jgi:hypothetical protein
MVCSIGKPPEFSIIGVIGVLKNRRTTWISADKDDKSQAEGVGIGRLRIKMGAMGAVS